jgi:threonine synthase
MGSLAQSGHFDLGAAGARFQAEFDARSADEAAVTGAIRRIRATSGYLMDPHTACGLVALEKAAPQSRVPGIVLSTAHPAKFPDALERITGKRPPLPPSFASLLTDPERYSVLENDVGAVKRFVEGAVSHSGAGAA